MADETDEPHEGFAPDEFDAETNVLLEIRPCSPTRRIHLMGRTVLALMGLMGLAAVSLALGGLGYRQFAKAAEDQTIQLVKPPLESQPRLTSGPGCPASCGFYTACTLTDKRIRSQLPLPRARLFNKDNVAFQQEYECPEVNGIQCKIPLLYKNDDFCDCPGCEDEDNHNCTTCGTDIPEEYSVLVTADKLVTCPDDCEAGFDSKAGYCVGGGQPLREGAEIFTCPGLNNSCEILAAARNDGRCDCPETCADEDSATCNTCGCPSVCNRPPLRCDAYCGGVFNCPKGFQCPIPLSWVNDDYCDCEDCADEQIWTCENCDCPRSCAPIVEYCGFIVDTWKCPNHDCEIPSDQVNDYTCNCPDCADEVMFTCETCGGVGCPTTCGADRISFECFEDFRPDREPIFTCNDGCEIELDSKNDLICDCSECEDEDRVTCETCSEGCPTECGDVSFCFNTFTCPDGCEIPLSWVNDSFCDCPGGCADEGFNISCDFCVCSEECVGGSTSSMKSFVASKGLAAFNGALKGANYTFAYLSRKFPTFLQHRRLSDSNDANARSRSSHSQKVDWTSQIDRKVRKARKAQGDLTLRRPLLRQMQDESDEDSTERRDRPQDIFDCGVPGCDGLDRRFVNDRICDCPNCADEDLFTCETCLPGTPFDLAFPQDQTQTVAAAGAMAGVAAGLALGLGLGLGLTGPLAALVVSRGSLVLESNEDLSNNVAVQQGLKRALARVAGGVAESAVTLLWACLSALGDPIVTSVVSPLRQLASMVTLCFEIEVRDEADGVDVCTKLMRVSGPGVESIIAEELAKIPVKVTVRVVEWSPDPNPLTLSPTAQSLEAKVPAVDDKAINMPSMLPA